MVGTLTGSEVTIGLAIIYNPHVQDENFGRVLIARRVDPEVVPSQRTLHWQFPYTTRTPTQSLVDTLRQAVLTQTGLDTELSADWIFYWKHPDHCVIDEAGRKCPVGTYYFSGTPRTPGQVARADGVKFAEVMWADPRDIPMRGTGRRYFTTDTPGQVITYLTAISEEFRHSSGVSTGAEIFRLPAPLGRYEFAV